MPKDKAKLLAAIKAMQAELEQPEEPKVDSKAQQRIRVRLLEAEYRGLESIAKPLTTRMEKLAKRIEDAKAGKTEQAEPDPAQTKIAETEEPEMVPVRQPKKAVAEARAVF